MNSKKYVAALSLAVVFLLAGGGYAIARYIGTVSLKNKVQTYIKNNGLEGKVNIGRYVYEPLTGVITLENVSLKGYAGKNFDITVDRIKILRYVQPEGYILPLEVKITATGVHLRKGNLQYVYSLYQEAYYDKKKNRYVLKQFRVDGKKFSLSVSAVFGNVSQDILKGGSSAAIPSGSLLDVVPERAVFHYRDWGYLKELDRDGMVSDKIQHLMVKATNEKVKDFLKAVLLVVKNGKGQVVVEFENRKKMSFRQVITFYFFAKTMDIGDVFSSLEGYFNIEVYYRGNV